TGYPPPLRPGRPGPHRASRDSCTPVQGSRCCLPRSIKERGSTGGARDCSPPCSWAAHCFFCALRCGVCAALILWWTYPICVNGTLCCWALLSSSFVLISSPQSFLSHSHCRYTGSRPIRLGPG